jgi:uncharacterized protein YkwD
LRKLLAVVLALPVLVLVYLSVALHRSAKSRIALAMIVAVTVGGGALGFRAPSGTTAVAPETEPPPQLELTFATRIEVNEAPDAPIHVHFPAAMDQDSVAALLEVDPDTPVQLSWDITSTNLTVRPTGTWEPGALHTITIEAGALQASGRPVAEQIRAVFLTRPATQATIAASELVAGRATIGAEFVIAFDRPIDEPTLALAVEPATEGSFEQVPATEEGVEYRFIPDEPLLPGKLYRVALADGVRDIDGQQVVLAAPLEIQTSTEPTVVRFRPRTRTADVELDATLSVRFSEAMDQGSTAGAWGVTADSAAVAGKVSFAEGDTVLVFDPDAPFANGQTVVMTVGTGARSRIGVPLATAVSSSFTTVAKPAATPTRAPTATASPSSGGGSVGTGNWAAVESYYLKLMNCTRTGGWVSSTGSCSGYGSNGTAPLWIDAGITANVARPYAKMLAVNNLCSHFIGGDPGDRLAAAGYTSYIWAENLGCRSGDPYAAVLGSHLYFQSEKSYSGGHYVNLMNPKYDRAGIGVWVASNRVRLVVDFYHPR